MYKLIDIGQQTVTGAPLNSDFEVGKWEKN